MTRLEGPKIITLTSCGVCHGHGKRGKKMCGACGGTGRGKPTNIKVRGM